MSVLVVIMMALLAWRIGVFAEWMAHRVLEAHEQDILLEIDEADWEDRHRAFRRSHPPIGHRKPYMSLGRRA